VCLLLRIGGADVSARKHGALRAAVWAGHTQVVRRLLLAGGDPRACDDYSLRAAIRNGNTEVLAIMENSLPYDE
jgi:hypothetical protein